MNIVKHLSVAAVALALVPSTWGQTYPSKTVRVIVPFGAGSGSDVGLRLLAQSLSQSTGQNFVVENRPGASGNIGVAAGAKSPPDGYTLVTGGLGVNAMNQFMYSPAEMGFDPVKDLEPIILVAKLPFLIAVSPSFAANTVPELVAAAKAKPGTINVAITQTSSRVVYELFCMTTGAPMFAVAYKASSSAFTDVMGGRVSVSMETLAALRPHVTSGRLKAVAVTSRKTSELLPNVSSVAEQGVKDFEYVGWISLYAPKGTPREAITLVNTKLNKILALAEMRKRFLDLGFEPGSGTPQDLADFENSERMRWGPLIKSANITAQ